MNRRQSELLANDFDLKIYNLLRTAELEASKSSGREKKEWTQIFNYLSAARPHVRNMMHPYDRQTTG